MGRKLTVVVGFAGMAYLFSCKHCGAERFDSQVALEFHQNGNACQMQRAMAAASAKLSGRPDELPRVEFDVIELEEPRGPFYNPLLDDDALDPIENENAPRDSDDDEDEPDGEPGAAVGDKRPAFDSARETLLWFNTAGPRKTRISNRGRDDWLKLMKDERYRLEEVLNQWKSHRDMDRAILKSALGEVRRGSLANSNLLWRCSTNFCKIQSCVVTYLQLTVKRYGN